MDTTVSNAAIKAFDRHLWYLTPELVFVSIFSESVPSEERKKVADALLAIKSHANTLKNPCIALALILGSPNFQNLSMKIQDYVT